MKNHDNTAVINEKMLENLRRSLPQIMSERRAEHTLAVESAAAEIGSVYAPDRIMILRAAALLHDITKEFTFEKQLQICSEFGIIISDIEFHLPKVFHSITAAAIIPHKFPQFADDNVISAVRYHTVGDKNMRLCDRIIYLADYIEQTRTHEDCQLLRDFYYSGLAKAKDKKERDRHFYMTMHMAFDKAINELVQGKKLIHPSLIEARNALILEFTTLKI